MLCGTKESACTFTHRYRVHGVNKIVCHVRVNIQDLARGLIVDLDGRISEIYEHLWPPFDLRDEPQRTLNFLKSGCVASLTVGSFLVAGCNDGIFD